MKKQVKSVLKSQMRWFSWVLLLVLPLVLVTSCSKDDGKKDDGNKEGGGASSAIAGTYSGSLSMLQLDGSYSPFGPADLIIRADGADKAVINTTISLPAPLTLSLDVNCPVNVTATDGGYTVAGETTVSISIYPTPIPVSVNGTIQTGNVKTAIIQIIPTNLGQFKYEGSTAP
jgi:hypothetical protein